MPQLSDEADLREALDLDSMDIFNPVVALSKRLAVDILDADAAHLATLGVERITWPGPSLREQCPLQGR